MDTEWAYHSSEYVHSVFFFFFFFFFLWSTLFRNYVLITKNMTPTENALLYMTLSSYFNSIINSIQSIFLLLFSFMKAIGAISSTQFKLRT